MRGKGMLDQLAEIAAEAGTLLKARKQTIAVVDGSTGGLISASLLAMPGASGCRMSHARVPCGPLAMRSRA